MAKRSKSKRPQSSADPHAAPAADAAPAPEVSASDIDEIVVRLVDDMRDQPAPEAVPAAQIDAQIAALGDPLADRRAWSRWHAGKLRDIEARMDALKEESRQAGLGRRAIMHGTQVRLERLRLLTLRREKLNSEQPVQDSDPAPTPTQPPEGSDDQTE